MSFTFYVLYSYHAPASYGQALLPILHCADLEQFGKLQQLRLSSTTYV